MATPEQLAAIHAAMMEELGICRTESLHLDNGKRLNQPVDLDAIEQGRRSKDPRSREFKITKTHAEENKAWKEACKDDTDVQFVDQLDHGYAHRKARSPQQELTTNPSRSSFVAYAGKELPSHGGHHPVIPSQRRGNKTSNPHLTRSDDLRNVQAAIERLRGMEDLKKKNSPNRQSGRKVHDSPSLSNDLQGLQPVIPKPNLSYNDRRSVNELPILKNISGPGYVPVTFRQMRQSKNSFILATPEVFLAAQGIGRSNSVKSPQLTSAFRSSALPTQNVGLASSIFANNNSSSKLPQTIGIVETVTTVFGATEQEPDITESVAAKSPFGENRPPRGSQNKAEENQDGIPEILFEATCKVETKNLKSYSISATETCIVRLLRTIIKGNTFIMLKITNGGITVCKQSLENNFKYLIDSAFLVFDSPGDEGSLAKWQLRFQFAHVANRLGQTIENHRMAWTKQASQVDLPISVPQLRANVSSTLEGASNLERSLDSQDGEHLISFSDSGEDVSENLLSSYAQDLMSLIDDEAIDRALETLNRDESLLNQISTVVGGPSPTKSAAELQNKGSEMAISIDLNGGLAASQYAAATNKIVSNLLRKSSVFRSLPEQVTTPYAQEMSRMVLKRAQNSKGLLTQSGIKPGASPFISYTVEDMLKLRSQARFVKMKLIKDEYTPARGSEGVLMRNLANAKHSKTSSQSNTTWSTKLPDHATQTLVSQRQIDSEYATISVPNQPSVSSMTSPLNTPRPAGVINASLDESTNNTRTSSTNLQRLLGMKGGLSSSRFASKESQNEKSEVVEGKAARVSRINEEHAFAARKGQNKKRDELAPITVAVNNLACGSSSISVKEKYDESWSASHHLVDVEKGFRGLGINQNSIGVRRESFGSLDTKDSGDTVRPMVVLESQAPVKVQQLLSTTDRPSRSGSRRVLRVRTDSSSTAESFETASEGNTSEEDDKRMIMPLGTALLPVAKCKAGMGSLANVPKSLPQTAIDTTGKLNESHSNELVAEQAVTSTEKPFGQPSNIPGPSVMVTASPQSPKLKGGLMSSRFASARNEAVYQASNPIERSSGVMDSSQRGIRTAKPVLTPNALADEFLPATHARSQILSANTAPLPKYGTVMVPDPSKPGYFAPVHGVVVQPPAEIIAARDATLARMHQGLVVAANSPEGNRKGQPQGAFIKESPSHPNSQFTNAAIPMTEIPGFTSQSGTRGWQHFPASTAIRALQSPSGEENTMPSTFAPGHGLSSPVNSNKDEVQREVRGRLEHSLAEKASPLGRRNVFN